MLFLLNVSPLADYYFKDEFCYSKWLIIDSEKSFALSNICCVKNFFLRLILLFRIVFFFFKEFYFFGVCGILKILQLFLVLRFLILSSGILRIAPKVLLRLIADWKGRFLFRKNFSREFWLINEILRNVYVFWLISALKFYFSLITVIPRKICYITAFLLRIQISTELWDSAVAFKSSIISFNYFNIK